MRGSRHLLFVSSFFFIGCNTTPVTVPNALQAPASRILAYQTQAKERTCTLIVIRDEGHIGSGCYFALHINGELAARMNPKEMVRFYVEPGEYLLRVGSDPQGRGLCSLGKDNWTQRETNFKAGETKYFRLSFDTTGKFDISRTDK